MSATAEKKRKTGRPPGKVSTRDDVAAKVDRELVELARMVSVHEKIPVAQVLSELLDAPLRRRYAEVIRKRHESLSRA